MARHVLIYDVSELHYDDRITSGVILNITLQLFYHKFNHE